MSGLVPCASGRRFQTAARAKPTLRVLGSREALPIPFAKGRRRKRYASWDRAKRCIGPFAEISCEYAEPFVLVRGLERG